jgi:uncharacterized repeat protein (TIGR01451 family)
MPRSLFSPPTTRRRIRFGFLTAVLSVICLGVSYISSAGSRALDISGANATLAAQEELNVPRVATDDKHQQAKPFPSAVESYGKLPLAFEINSGQTDAEVKFVARGQGYGLFLTSSSAVFSLTRPIESDELNQTRKVNSHGESSQQPSTAKTEVLTVRFEGSHSVAHPVGLNRLPGKSNYFIGNKSRNWHTNIAAYSKVMYRNIYPGIDLVYYGNQRQLEYDLIVAPGTSPSKIRMAFAGMKGVTVDSNGDLLLSTAAGDLRQHKPFAYQMVDGTRQEVAAAYRVDRGSVRFEVGAYNKNLPLMIDPVFVYSSYVGGSSNEQGLGIAVDSQGSAYLTGSTASTNFPLAAALQGAKDAVNDAFIVKLNPAGNAFVYSTYLGANGDDVGNAIAVDSQGNAYVTGLTGSGSFPRTAGAFQDSKDGLVDAFVAKLNPSGSALEYSSFIGGDNNDTAFGIAVDGSNRAYVVGRTDSNRFRVLPFSTPRRGSAVYKSTDAAAHWSPSAAGFTGSTVACLTQDPVTANTIYAGTTIGVFKSTDAGANWILTGSNPPVNAPLSTNAVVVDSSNSSTIYAASNAGVYKSTNGGGTYTQKNTGLLSLFVFALAVDTNAPSILYAGTQSGAYKSLDGGDNWVAVNNGTSSSRVNKIVIDPSQSPATTIYLGMFNRGMLKSTNGGALWTPINTGLTSTIPINALAIDPTNPSTLFAGVPFGSDIVFKTTNGGGSWIPSDNGLLYTFAGQPAFPSVNTLVIDPFNSATVYASTSGGALYKSSDGGANWSQANTGFVNNNATAIAIDRTNPENLFAATAIGSDVFAMRFSASGGLEYLVNFGGDENDEARGVAVDSAGNAYVAGFTNSNNLPVVSALQPASAGLSDAFVAKLNSTGSAFSYLTYLGGISSDQARGIAVRGGNAYVVGSTSSSNFPLASPLKSTLADFDTDAFITKLNAAGNALDFSTYLGGEGSDQGFAIAVDASGSTYATGVTTSIDFPIVSAPQPINLGTDAFVTKLNPANTITYSTFIGGSSIDQGNGIAVDSTGNAYVIGNTSSGDFPTANPLQSYRGNTDAFVAKLGAAADVVLTLTGSPNSVPFGSDLTYTIVVSNAGELPAENVSLSNSLLSGTGVISINTTRGTCSGNRFINCDFGTLDPGANATVTLVVRPPAIATMIDTATATTTTPDANMANNTATLSTPVVFTDVMVRNTSALNLTEIGGVNTYIITVTNKGPAAASMITVTDSLPPELTFVGCTSTNSGVCGGAGNNRTVTVSSLAVGASFTATIAAQLNNAVAPGTVISNTASMTSVVPDINPNNNAQTATTTARAAVSGPALNGSIAFVSRDGSFTSGDEIWLANSEGTGQRNIGFPGVAPAWSPDGARLAVSGSPYGLFVLNADGSNQVQLTTSSQDGSPTWSPDGTRLAFGGSRGPGTFGIYVMNSDGTNVKRIADGNDPSWSPDGTRFAFFAIGQGFSVMYADGSGVRSISLPNTPFPGYGWSPDSSKLVIAIPDNTTLGSSVYTVNADGTGLTKIDNTSGGSSPCWSPDGTKIAFSLSASTGPDAGVYTINLNGTDLLKINGEVKEGYQPDWQRQPPNFTPLPQSFSISGKLTNAADGTSVPAAVRVTGSFTRTVNADQNGNYKIKGLASGGNYTLTPSIFGSASATPANRQYNNLSANQTGADFAFTFPPPVPVTGHVLDPNGAPLVNVRLALGNSFSPPDAFTDVNGFYTFGSASTGFQAYVIPFAEGNYANYQFDPQIRFIQNHSGNDFVGRPKTASVSGTVTVGGVGKAGVPLFTSNPPATSTTTDANGNYTFNGIGEGLTLTVQVDTQTYPFTPASQTVTVNGQMTGVNFAAPLNQFLISGHVADPSSSAIAGVTMTLGGAASATTQTDSQGNFSFGLRAANANYTVAASKTGYTIAPNVHGVQNLASNTQLNYTGYLNTLEFYSDSTTVTVGETGGTVTLNVVRTGLLSGTLKVNYRTVDGTAGQRTDYTATLGTLTFEPKVQLQRIVVPINDDAYVEGDESFTVTLSNPDGALIGTAGSAVVTIVDDDTAAPTVNPLDTGSFFVRQHYLDFLNRIPDASGLTFWSEQITDCGLDTICTDLRRINVSAAFYLSIEFQETGYLVERLYKSAYGDATGISNFGPIHTLPVPIVRFDEFLPDTQQIGSGVVVGVGSWQAQLEANKVQFTQDFVSRSRFVTAYPTTLTPAQFVDGLFTNAGVAPSDSERTSIINEFGGAGTTGDMVARARALRRVAENTTLKQQETNKAFVLMQYFGYLRRNPNDTPDSDYSGYDFWLTKLNEFNGNFVNADMVKAFIVSGEYRQRFGP